jgi:hypothetical protein
MQKNVRKREKSVGNYETTLKLNKRGIHVPHPGASADNRVPKVESG